MKTLIYFCSVFFILCLYTLPSTAQTYTISFDTSDTTIRQEKNDDIIYEFRFTLSSDIPKKLKNDSLFISVNPEKSSLPTNGYKLSGNHILFNDLKKNKPYSFYLKLKKGHSEKTDRKLVLIFETPYANPKFSNNSASNKMVITVKGLNETIAAPTSTTVLPTAATAYPVSFNSGVTTLQKTKDKDVKYEFTLLAGTIPDSLLTYVLKIEPDSVHSTLPSADYTLADTTISLNQLKKKGTHSFSLTLKKDSLTDRERKLILKAELYDAGKEIDNLGETQKMTLSVKGIKPAAEASNYQISFKSSDTTIQKNRSGDVLYEFILTAPQIPDTLKNAKLRIIANAKSSTLATSEYELLYADISLSELKKKKNHSFFLRLKGDTLPDRDRKLVLEIEIYGTDLKLENTGEKQRLSLTVKGIEPPLNDFNYLAYVGTNFDLVEGIKAKNLFFATNIFIPNRTRKYGVGYYLSLYGNRTLSSVDSSSTVRLLSEVRNSGDTSILYWDRAKMIRTRVSDNLGAYCSPLINMGNVSINPHTQLYLAPSFEFIWRRTKVNSVFSERTRQDTTTIVRNDSIFPVYTENVTSNFNEFNFNAGLGLFVAHENKRISMRVHASVGYTSIYRTAAANPHTMLDIPYTRQGDIFFSGKAWITEATTGITLQAEVYNTLNILRPYYVVTLSKAIDFKHLGNIFQPITSR